MTIHGRVRRKFARVVIIATKDKILNVDVVVNEKGSLLKPKNYGKIHYFDYP